MEGQKGTEQDVNSVNSTGWHAGVRTVQSHPSNKHENQKKKKKKKKKKRLKDGTAWRPGQLIFTDFTPIVLLHAAASSESL